MIAPEPKPVERGPTTLIRTAVFQGQAEGATDSIGRGSGVLREVMGAGVSTFGPGASSREGSAAPASGPTWPGLDWPQITGTENVPQPIRTIAATSFSLDRDIILRAPSMRTRTAEGTRLLAAPPAASWAAIREVASIEAVQAADRADWAESNPAEATAAGATPRRIIRPRRCSRPRASRLLIVPTGRPSTRAASS
jgi:hypothetical protein